METGDEDRSGSVAQAHWHFLTLLFKRKLTTLVGALSPVKAQQLDRALAIALDLNGGNW